MARKIETLKDIDDLILRNVLAVDKVLVFAGPSPSDGDLLFGEWELLVLVVESNGNNDVLVFDYILFQN
jgi:hypothetical protein